MVIHKKNVSADGGDNDSGYITPFPHIPSGSPGNSARAKKDLLTFG